MSATSLQQRLACTNTILHFLLLRWLFWPSDWPDEPSGDIISYLISPVCPPGVLRGSPIQTSQPAFMDTLFPPFCLLQLAFSWQPGLPACGKPWPGHTPPLRNYTQESNPQTYYTMLLLLLQTPVELHKVLTTTLLLLLYYTILLLLLQLLLP